MIDGSRAEIRGNTALAGLSRQHKSSVRRTRHGSLLRRELQMLEQLVERIRVKQALRQLDEKATITAASPSSTATSPSTRRVQTREIRRVHEPSPTKCAVGRLPGGHATKRSLSDYSPRRRSREKLLHPKSTAMNLRRGRKVTASYRFTTSLR